MLARHLNLLRAAADNVAARPGGYGLATLGLIASLTLLLAGVAISEGVRAEALASVDAGADIYVTGDAFGREAPLPRHWLDRFAELNGVRRVVPRIIGRLPLGDEIAVIIGVPREAVANANPPIVGRAPASEAEVLVGRVLADELGLRPGSRIALEGATSRVFTVAGIIDGTAALWSAKAVTCDLEEAAIVFGLRDHVTDACLDTRPGYADEVADAIEQWDEPLRVQTRTLVKTYVTRGMTIRGGLLALLCLVVLAGAIPAFAVTTYLGHVPRRREVALLKAEGWRTADVLEMVALENALVSFVAAGLAITLAWLWVRGLGAPIIAGFFLTDLPAFPEMRIPARFLPVPALLAIAFSLVVTMTGSIYTTWRTATARPGTALR
ncbi:MAG: ABC transporter permease [Phycisphaerales bacterium]|nr:ABC transporter permease [Phycisphaerae bacterium]NNM26742.1 ABC transporter permease [Phycisphaerales bacterium]